jgi:hypothetical protein
LVNVLVLGNQVGTKAAFLKEWAECTDRAEGRARLGFHKQGCERRFEGAVVLKETVKVVTQAEMAEAGKKLEDAYMEVLRFEELHNHGVPTIVLEERIASLAFQRVGTVGR